MSLFNYKEVYEGKPDIEHSYLLNGRVPIKAALPIALQHLLAMLVSNITPVLIVASVSGVDPSLRSDLIQNAMLIAAIGTLLQIYPLSKVGSGLPIIMGTSFTFVAIATYIGSTSGFGTVMGAIFIAGIITGILGLFAKYWRKFIPPIVSASVVTAIGFSLLPVGAKSFGGGDQATNFGSMENWIVGSVTLIVCILLTVIPKGFLKNLSILIGLLVGYILSIFLGLVDFSSLWGASLFKLPHFMPVALNFEPISIISILIIYIVSATEMIGGTETLTNMALGRKAKTEELSGSVSCGGFSGAIGALFGAMPLTTYNQNIGLVIMTTVINRFTIGFATVAMLIAAFSPIFSSLLSTVPDSVLGGCIIMMFGTIVISGIEMISRCGFTQRNITILSISFSIGVGFTQVPALFNIFPPVIQSIFGSNCVSVVFLISLILNLVLPKNMEKELFPE